MAMATIYFQAMIATCGALAYKLNPDGAVLTKEILENFFLIILMQSNAQKL